LGQWDVILQRGFGNNRYSTAMIYVSNVNVMMARKLMWLILKAGIMLLAVFIKVILSTFSQIKKG
jgi:hypothetical protein